MAEQELPVAPDKRYPNAPLCPLVGPFSLRKFHGNDSLGPAVGPVKFAENFSLPFNPRLGDLAFKRAQRLIVHIPSLENDKNCLRTETSTDELTEDTRSLLLILRFRHAFSF